MQVRQNQNRRIPTTDNPNIPHKHLHKHDGNPHCRIQITAPAISSPSSMAETSRPPPPHSSLAGAAQIFFFLLLLLLGLSSAAAQRFREAPQFYNPAGCPPPLPPSPDSDCRPEASVHIAMTLDAAYLRGSMAAIHSVLRHSSCPQSVQFHLVASSSSSSSIELLNITVAASFPSLAYKIYPFDESAVSKLISPSLRSALDRPLNYARSYLADLLPRCARRIVYLDSDLLVLDDVARLAGTPLPGSAALAAPEYCGANFTSYFTAAFWGDPAMSGEIWRRRRRRRPCYFNTGVMVMDLGRWREGGFTERIEGWMKVQRKVRIYELGSLPPFLLVFAGRIAAVDHRWNQHGLGGDNLRGLCRDLHPGPASLLHWSGKGKPWDRLDAGRPCPIDALWAPYDLLDSPSLLLVDS